MKQHGLNEQQLQKIKAQPGFIAALDQSGGSTPGALKAYGIKEGAWSDEDEMFGLVHQMRARIITSASFTGARRSTRTRRADRGRSRRTRATARNAHGPRRGA